MPFKDPEEKRANQRAWCKKKRSGPRGGEIRDYHRAYRARKKGVEVDEVPVDWEATQLLAQDNCCYLCGCKIGGVNGSRIDFQADHIIALANGGRHAVSNLALACEPCNRNKGTSSLPPLPAAPDDEAVF